MKPLLQLSKKHFADLSWELSKNQAAEEATLLFLNSQKARKSLNWKPKWGIEDTIEKTAAWYHEFIENGKVISTDQIAQYLES